MSVVAIVGRPNVGKSALFNKIIGKRKALVSDMPGVTRDRHYNQADWCGTEFTLIDTGGLSFDETDAVEAKVHMQSLAALEEADVVICIFDGMDGLTPIDRDIVDIFRKSGRKVVYAVNKLDTKNKDSLTADFSKLGVDLIPLSAEHSRNIDLLLDKVIEMLTPKEIKKDKDKRIRIALVGRPNVGKSTIINHLAKEERVVAHELPGTTRDSIDVEIDHNDREYIFVDTAGVKKRAQTREKIDKFSTMKSLRAIEDAAIVFIVLDGAEGFTRQDFNLIAHSFGLFRPTAVLVNKWDLVGQRQKDYIRDLRVSLKELHDIPILCISGKTGESCDSIFKVAAGLEAARKVRLPTSGLNQFFEELTSRHPVPDWRGKHVKLNYITQVDTEPQVFIVFTNEPRGVEKSYRSYLTKSLRKLLGPPMVPMVVKFRKK